MKARAIHQALLKSFGSPEWGQPTTPLDELILTILSQNTNDRNRDVAYQYLRKRFPTWDQVRDAQRSDVIDAIRTAGLANQKGARIQSMLREITAERGNLDLEFLHDLPMEKAREWLLHFKGVGPKTTAIVLLFSLGKPAFPVDTHIYRVTGRMGLRPQKMDREKAHLHLEQLFQPEMYAPVHLNLIRLGREICHSRNPDCEHCPANPFCDYYLDLKKK
jgi:endonuclease-3